MDWATILTSAAVASVISATSLLINDYFRRKSEEKRVMLETAIKLTELRNEQILEIIKRTAKETIWPAPLNTFEKTFKRVKNIWEGKNQEEIKTPLKI